MWEEPLSYGIITEDMEPTIAEAVAGHEVWDLGAGDLGHAQHLLRLGASSIVAVDKEYREGPVPDLPGIRIVSGYFADLAIPDRIEVALVAWPVNYAHTAWALLRILERAETVIYLGSNTSGNACGSPVLFQALTQRKLLAHVPHRRNTLLVYGREGRGEVPLTGEEYAATTGQFLTYEVAQGHAGGTETPSQA
jgi:hypothetical protein